MSNDTFATFIELLQSSALMGFGALLFGFLAKRLAGTALSVALGMLFGAGAILTMMDPVVIMPGVLADGRTTLIIVAGLFGGPIASAMSSVAAAAYRIHVGGAGVEAGLVTIATATVVGLVGYAWVRRRDGVIRSSDILILAVLAPLTTFSALMLPYAQVMPLLMQTLVPLGLVRVFSLLFLGLLLLHELRRIEAEREVHRLAYADELSGLDNRRAFYLHLDQAWERWRRYHEVFAVMLIDIDRFKSINDRFGHPVGDDVIRAVGGVLKEECRTSDVAARIGGEEFAILLTHTTSHGAQNAAERIRARIGKLRLNAGTIEFGVTVSIGVAADSIDHATAQDGLSSADRALYEAKRSGRDRVVVTHTVAMPLPDNPRPRPRPAARARSARVVRSG